MIKRLCTRLVSNTEVHTMIRKAEGFLLTPRIPFEELSLSPPAKIKITCLRNYNGFPTSDINDEHLQNIVLFNIMNDNYQPNDV